MEHLVVFRLGLWWQTAGDDEEEESSALQFRKVPTEHLRLTIHESICVLVRLLVCFSEIHCLSEVYLGYMVCYIYFDKTKHLHIFYTCILYIYFGSDVTVSECPFALYVCMSTVHVLGQTSVICLACL